MLSILLRASIYTHRNVRERPYGGPNNQCHTLRSTYLSQLWTDGGDIYIVVALLLLQ
jgi:hypothetical protein